MMRFILKNKADKWDNAVIVSDIDKLEVKAAFTKWVKLPEEDRTLFSDYLSENFPDNLIIDLREIEDCTVEE
ncbi:hypothetical protein [Paenibacillus odorifer]|uniref:hypothetical protein n=1 Tax=Paenibacillus odorifer TaxID=189426 RepID=UPI00096E80CE|nr:hypothetical protein [Paenibacillus odorifer]OMD76836.1 hypothetical protein BSK50_13875 [Paenibacillus odorifer]